MRKIAWIIVIIVLIVGIVLLVKKQNKSTEPQQPPVVKDVQNIGSLSLFKNGLAASGIQADDIGYHDFSSDGKYFFLSVFKKGGDPANKGYLIDTATGVVTDLPGTVDRGISDSRVMQLYKDGGITLYWPDVDQSKTYMVGDNAFFGSLSPNGDTYVVNTQKGIQKIDIASGTITAVSAKQYDGAFAWFSDSNRMVGIQETNEDLQEAGRGRRVGIWNISTGTFTALPITLDQKTIRFAEWVIPDKVVRVNAGYDDGSFDYLVDVTNNKVTKVGDTSSGLMGGSLVTDKALGLFATMLNPDGNSQVATIYRGTDKVANIALTGQYSRESVAIVDDHTLIYIRTAYGEESITNQAVIKLDLKEGTESVIQSLPQKRAALSLAPDHKTWVSSAGTQLFTGTL